MRVLPATGISYSALWLALPSTLEIGPEAEDYRLHSHGDGLSGRRKTTKSKGDPHCVRS